MIENQSDVYDLQEKIKRRLLHEIYITIILVIFLIIISTAKVGASAEVNSYISFAATLSSLILAVFAIFLTLNGNSELARFTSSVAATNESLKLSAREMADNLNRTTINSNSLQAEIGKLSQLVSGIGGIFDARFEKFTDQTKSLYSMQSPKNDKDSQADESFSREDFLRDCSPAGITVLLYLSKRQQKNEAYSVEDIAKVVKVSLDYIRGFIVACDSARIIKINTIDAKSKVYSIIFSGEDLQNSVEEKIGIFIHRGKKVLAKKIQKILNSIINDVEDESENVTDDEVVNIHNNNSEDKSNI